MKAKAIIPLVLGLAVGLLAVKFLVDTIKKAQASGQASELITAVRAKQDISAHQEIRPELVELVETKDARFAPKNDRIESLEKVVGRVAAKAIPASAPVLLSMLAPEGTPAGMVGRIPPGFRAVSVRIDEKSGVGYHLQPGDWVDVIVVMDVDTTTKTGARAKETIAEVILQHVQVAAIGRAQGADGAESAGKQQVAKSATLLVPEEDVPKLHLAGTRGKITLAMRGEDEQTTAEAPFAKGNEILSSMRRPQDAGPDASGGLSPFNSWLQAFTTPAPDSTPATTARELGPIVQEEPPPPHEVLVYRGSPDGQSGFNIERITFENAGSSNILEAHQGFPSHAVRSIEKPQQKGRVTTTRSDRESSQRGGDLGNSTEKSSPTAGE